MMYWRYLKVILKHKWYVFLECVRLGIPWLGIIHDRSKLTPAEFLGYARKFGREGGKHADSDDEAFRLAWLHHQKANKHHWQYWIVHIPVVERLNEKGLRVSWADTLFACMPDKIHPESKSCIPIPHRYRREMLADWIGAGRTYVNASTVTDWYRDNRDKMLLHPETREWVERQLL